MSARRPAFKIASMEMRFRTLQDIFIWNGYSSLQKWLIVAALTLSVSLISCLWSVIFLFILASAGGFKLSEQILHHDKTSHYAELLFYKLESLYIELKFQIRKLKTCIVGKQDHQDSSVSSTQIISELSVGCDTDSDKQSDRSGAVKMSTELRMEINSIQLLIIRDFIRSWYADFSYDAQFLKESKYFLQQAFSSLSFHISQQDAKFLITKIIQLYLLHFTMYQKARDSFESHKIHPKTKVPLKARFKRHCSVDAAFGILTPFHPALESEEKEIGYLRGIVSLIILSTCKADVIEGRCVRTLLVNILTDTVMLPVMKMMSNPDWLMEVIVLVTSDEEVVGREMDVSRVKKNDMESEDNNGETAVDRKDKCESQMQDNGANISLLKYQECFEDDLDVQVPPDADQFDKTLTDNADETLCEYQGEFVTMIEEAPLESDNVTYTSSKHSSPTELQPQSSHKQLIDSKETLTSYAPCDSPSSPNLHENPLDDLSCTASKQLTKANSVCTGKAENGESRDPMVPEQKSSESTSDICEEDLDLLHRNPQQILSYGKRLSSASTESDLSSIAGTSIDGNALLSSSESDTIPEAMSSSFPKLSSLKNFFVDSLIPSGKQQILKKPKTLSLVTEKISSNLKSMASLRSENNDNQMQKPPQVLVDGIPLESPNTKAITSAPSSSAVSPSDCQSSANSDSEMTPSPGFFSGKNFGAFFSHSSPAVDSSSPMVEKEAIEESPIPTPSPISSVINFDAMALVKDNDDDQLVSKCMVIDDRRIFQDVSIPHTMVGKEYRSSTQYCLYVIQYEALYFTEEGKSVIRSGEVRRRHREFINLQSRLEGRQTFKIYLKNIKGPKRWPTLPFKSLDKDTVEGRRIFLEKYLKDLIEIEAICNGPDLREFLAYEGDSHIAFVKKSPDITVPRLDKMFMRGVSGVVDRIKALPNIPQEVMSGFRGRESSEEKQGRSQNQIDADMIEVSTSYQTDGVSEAANILYESSLCVLEDLDTDEDKELFHDVITDPRNVEQENELFKQEVEKVQESLVGDEGESSDEAASSRTSDLDLGLVVLELLVQGLQNNDHWMCRDRVVRSMQSVLGKALNRYLESSISALVTDSQLTHYLRLLRETIWPQGQLWSESRPVKTDDQRAATREQTKRCLVNFFPESVRMAIGAKDFEEMISGFLNSLESEQLNRHLLYSILDLLIEQLFPEVTGHDFLEDLLFCRPRIDKTFI